MSEIEERYLEIPKDEKIVVVCHTGERSWRVVAFLQKLGFTNVINMKKDLKSGFKKDFQQLVTLLRFQNIPVAVIHIVKI